MKIIQILKWNLWWRGPLHKFVCWYLKKCGDMFHCYKYGRNGRYVVLMDEKQYPDYRKYIKNKTLDELLK